MEYLKHIYCSPSVLSQGWQSHTSPHRSTAGSYLGSIHTDNPIAVSRAVIEVGNSNSLLACRNPVLLRAGVNLEDMGSGGEDGLFSGIGRDRRNGCMSLQKVKCPSSPALTRHIESTRQRAPGNPQMKRQSNNSAEPHSSPEYLPLASPSDIQHPKVT